MSTQQSEINQDIIKDRKAELEKIHTVFKALTTDTNGNKLKCECIWTRRTRRLRECMYCKEYTEGVCSNLECDNYSHPSLEQCNECGIWKLDE